MNKYTYIWGHRGASGYLTDNTVDAFNLAITQGADGIESDVAITKDDEIVFFHDYYIVDGDKKTRPAKLSLNEIQRIKLDDEGRTVPTVREVFEKFSNKKNLQGKEIRFSLDIVNTKAGLKLIELAREFDIEHNVEISFDDYRRFDKFRRVSKDIVLVDSAKINFWKKFSKRIFYLNFNKLKYYNIKAINLKAQDALNGFSKQVQKEGFLLYVWDCHSEDILKKFLNQNVDAVYTNYPDLAVKLRKEIQGI